MCSREGIRGGSSNPVCVVVNSVVSIPCGRDWSVVSPELNILTLLLEQYRLGGTLELHLFLPSHQPSAVAGQGTLIHRFR